MLSPACSSAVSAEIIDYLLDFGHCEHHQRGAPLYYFDKRGHQRLQRLARTQTYRRLAQALDVYAVASKDGELITVGHRHKRINHN